MTDEAAIDALEYVLTYGRHKGRTLRYVRDNDLPYLVWTSELNLRNPILKRYVELVLRTVREPDGRTP